jgi:hypothetical protein
VRADGLLLPFDRLRLVPVGCQYYIRIWESGEWQTRTAEAGRGAQTLCLETRWSKTQSVIKAGLNARLPI